MAKEPKTLDELFHDTLKDIYFAEKKILATLPKMAKAAQNGELKAAFEKHRDETEGQVERLDQVFAIIDKKPQGKTCAAIVGITEEGAEIMQEYKRLASRSARSETSWYRRASPDTTTRGFASVDDRNVAVCLLPGTELAFEEEVRCGTGMVFSWRLGHTVAKFQQVDKNWSNVHHDALEFPDGKIVLLTHLCKGQRATVLQLPASPRATVEEPQQYASLAV